jgi:hypothetical protein
MADVFTPKKRWKRRAARAYALRRRRSFADVGEHHASVREARRDFERASEGLDVAAQVAHVHVSVHFELRHGGLAHCRRRGDVLL